ncbi:DNA-binding protein [Sporosarcina sp. FA9]|uniref:DNA-binding protein n=1 Tax=Sporosarcina sp. FA9 TaxID=3413030 RepID=UPI003F656094
MLTMEFDYEKLAEALRPVIREEIQVVMKDTSAIQNLPPLLTRVEMMKLLHISSWKATELIGRPDFPVCREAGLLFPTDMLFEWIKRNTQWIEDNTKYFQAG